MTNLLLLFYEYFKIGLFAIGGGPATLPFLMDLAKNRPWYTMTDLTNMLAISESTPGPLGVNMATYVGFHVAGVPGALVATFALTLPSVVIIIIVARFLNGFSDNPKVRAVFAGIRPAVTALIAVAVLNIFKASLLVENASGEMELAWKSAVLCVVVFGMMHIKKLKKMHPAFWLLIAAVVGIILKF